MKIGFSSSKILIIIYDMIAEYLLEI